MSGRLHWDGCLFLISRFNIIDGKSNPIRLIAENKSQDAFKRQQPEVGHTNATLLLQLFNSFAIHPVTDLFISQNLIFQQEGVSG